MHFIRSRSSSKIFFLSSRPLIRDILMSQSINNALLSVFRIKSRKESPLRNVSNSFSTLISSKAWVIISISSSSSSMTIIGFVFIFLCYVAAPFQFMPFEYTVLKKLPAQTQRSATGNYQKGGDKMPYSFLSFSSASVT